MNPKILYSGQGYKSAVLFLVAFVMMLNFSCKKYLDIKQSNNVVLLSTAADCQLLLDDYNSMNVNFPSDGELSAGDFYLSTSFFNTISGEDGEDQAFYTWMANAQRQSATTEWTDTYNVVYNSNLVLECLANIHDGTPQSVLNNLKGSALFFRAFAFWNVAQLFAKPYNAQTAGTDPGIPLRLVSDINAKTVRGTVQQDYVQITGDLNLAASLMADSSSIASRPSKTAAFAMLARVYLSMGDYPDALNASSAALQHAQLLDYNTLNPNAFPNAFGPRFGNKEDIFHTVMNADNAMLAYSGHAKIDTSLVASYNSNDLRSQFFFTANGDGSYYFNGNYDATFYSAAFYDGLATDELYLTRAECYARAGNTNAAMADLNTLLADRWVTGTYTNMTATSADDALAKILVERRKELVMRGQRWTDLRRLNMDPRFAVTLTRVENGQTFTLPPNDFRYTLLIPQQVILFSGIAQNPR
jgi:hypothetical protein